MWIETTFMVFAHSGYNYHCCRIGYPHPCHNTSIFDSYTTNQLLSWCRIKIFKLFERSLSQTQFSIRCYLNPVYGYIFQQEEPTEFGIQIKLRQNQTVNSMFPEPIDNVVRDVQYYTNDIVRFKFYDDDNQRYEVRSIWIDASRNQFLSRYQFYWLVRPVAPCHHNMNSSIHRMFYLTICFHSSSNVVQLKLFYLTHLLVVLYSIINFFK